MNDNLTDEQLIEAVAVEVFGATKDQFDETCQLFWDDVDEEWVVIQVHDDYESTFSLTNANHWMMVVERMIEKEFLFAVATVYIVTLKADDPPGLYYRVEFRKPYKKGKIKDRKSIGHAICLAALEAVRSQKK
jgi:hypothetical protein